MRMDNNAPKMVGELKTVDLADKLIPFVDGQPHFMRVMGSPHFYLPCFDDEEQLKSTMELIGTTVYTVKKIDDGHEFLESIPEDIKIALNFRQMPNGKIRWTEIQR